MKISSILISFSIFLALPKCCWFNRGVISDLDDESFEMLIAGGYQADYAVLGRHVVSIRTIDKIRYNGDNHFCTGNVRPIQRRTFMNITEGLRCITMGWGQVYSHGPYSNEILFLSVLIARHEHCEMFIKHYHREGNLCVEPVAEGEVCPGDLGGPLMCKDTLAGVIGGIQVCEGVQAIKFVNFSHYKDWVYKTITGIGDGTHSIQLGQMWLLLIYFQLFIGLVS
ncbi:chymotrypsin-2 isoform X2 [Drosophila willistoni]|uniref:chymotrypsin-2 isoform X2 n=1 Tax=Drosophila willistoni TaxID=7260 RepID=UPI001F07DAD0|nr:chymotrypsin-2 isoform X2 [Drosophila willistoni]